MSMNLNFYPAPSSREERKATCVRFPTLGLIIRLKFNTVRIYTVPGCILNIKVAFTVDVLDSERLTNRIMVQYVVQSKGAIPKWTVVELQGKLEMRKTGSEAFDGRYFGDLHFDASNTPILILGHHILQGKIQKLDKPFAVIEKDAKQQFNVKGKM